MSSSRSALPQPPAKHLEDLCLASLQDASGSRGYWCTTPRLPGLYNQAKLASFTGAGFSVLRDIAVSSALSSAGRSCWPASERIHEATSSIAQAMSGTHQFRSNPSTYWLLNQARGPAFRMMATPTLDGSTDPRRYFVSVPIVIPSASHSSRCEYLLAISACFSD